MADKKYIAYDDAFHALDTVAMPLSTYECLVGRFCDIPAADVAPVVRCKDCKHSYDNVGGRCCAHGVCVDCVVGDDFYCADGKRKEQGE